MFSPLKRVVAGALAVGALALGASAIAGAATSTSTTSSTPTTPSGRPAPPPFNGPAPGSAAHENAEKTVTGASASKAQAAAVKSVSSGTAGPVTTDFAGHGYEVTVTKSDGSKIEVHLDSSYRVTPGPGGPCPGGHGGPPPAGSGAAPPAGQGSTPPAGSGA